jgi:DNA-binding NarL/FixJ family response regulator
MTGQGKPFHLFVSARGDLLPSWQEAFPDTAAPGAFEGPSVNGTAPLLTWVRLRPGQPVAAELDTARRRVGNLPIVALSDRPDDDEALACFAAAARGYCNSHAAPAVLRQVAGVALQGGLWIGEALMQRLLQATARLPLPAPAGAPAADDWAAALTERERQVATAVAAGASNKEVARQFDITERTVKAHVGAILDKLGVRDRLQLSLVVHGRRPR